MMFSNTRLLISTFTLICCAVASSIGLHRREQTETLGYMAVSADQAALYNNAGTLTDGSNSTSRQIGKGIYTTPDRGGVAGSPGSWYCVILADSDAIARVSKAWIPEKYTGLQLWFATEKSIDRYITSLNYSWDPSRTLRLSIVDGMAYQDAQLMIPAALLNSNGGEMGITASCTANVDDLADSTVDYDSWQYNIGGNRT